MTLLTGHPFEKLIRYRLETIPPSYRNEEVLASLIKWVDEDIKRHGPIKCCLCGTDTPTFLSHNAEPIHEGRCCEICNDRRVNHNRLLDALEDVDNGTEES